MTGSVLGFSRGPRPDTWLPSGGRSVSRSLGTRARLVGIFYPFWIPPSCHVFYHFYQGWNLVLLKPCTAPPARLFCCSFYWATTPRLLRCPSSVRCSVTTWFCSATRPTRFGVGLNPAKRFAWKSPVRLPLPSQPRMVAGRHGLFRRR